MVLMFILVISLTTGEITYPIEVNEYATMEECLAHKRQKEYTEFPTQEYFKVFICEERN